MDVTDWMLDSDPALRWRVERDLAGAGTEVYEATRARIPTEGFGAALLALQDEDGQWAGGSYFPREIRHPVPWGDRESQPWIATTWVFNTLREWGMDAAPLAGTAEKLTAHSRWDYDDLPYWGGEVDACINGFTLDNGAWLGADVAPLIDWFAEHQLSDGGWNCEWVEGATTSSVHSTLNSLVGLLWHERFTGTSLRHLRAPAEQWLLARDLLYKRGTSDYVVPTVPVMEYPFRWRYGALRVLDYFRAAATVDGDNRDPRMADAVALVRAARQDDGTWLQGRRDPGAVWLLVDADEGEPSKWLTFYATRILAWWDA